MTSISSLGPALKRACHTKKFFRFLDSWQCGPLDGGCLIVAEALRQALGRGEIWGLYGFPISHLQPGKAITGTWQHAVLRVDGLYFDGDGCSTWEELEERWQEQEAVLVTGLRYTPDILATPSEDHPYDLEVAQKVALYFRRKLGLIPSRHVNKGSPGR